MSLNETIIYQTASGQVSFPLSLNPYRQRINKSFGLHLKAFPELHNLSLFSLLTTHFQVTIISYLNYCSSLLISLSLISLRSHLHREISEYFKYINTSRALLCLKLCKSFWFCVRIKSNLLTFVFKAHLIWPLSLIICLHVLHSINFLTISIPHTCQAGNYYLWSFTLLASLYLEHTLPRPLPD